jgi:DNA-binding transcriptional LysR family regulator
MVRPVAACMKRCAVRLFARAALVDGPDVQAEPGAEDGRPDCTERDRRGEYRPPWWSAKFDQPVTGPAVAAELPWVWIPRTISPDYHDQVVACCRAAGFAPDARHTARSITSQLAMVACGLGVALVPESATLQHAAEESESIYFTLVKNSAEIDLAAVCRRGGNGLILGFVNCVRAVVD